MAKVQRTVFGYPNLSLGSGVLNANNLIAAEVGAPRAGVLIELALYVEAPGSGANHCRLGLYTGDNTPGGGQPVALVAETAEFSPVAGWNFVPVVTPVSIPVGSYWIAGLSDDDISVNEVSGPGKLSFATPTTYGPLPDPFVSTGDDGRVWAMQAVVMPTD